MYDGIIKTAAAAPAVRPGDVIGNAKSIYEKVVELSERGVKLAVFPELSVTGYTCEDLFLQSALLDGCEREVAELINKTKDIDMVYIIGAPLVYSQKLYNTAVCIHKGRILGIVPKSNIPNYSEFYEARQFSSGKELKGAEISYAGRKTEISPCLVFSSDLFSFGIEICEDLWVGDSPSVKLAACGADIICNLSASDEVIGKPEYRRTIVSAKSGSLYCGYIYANAGFGESTTDKVYSGHSLIAADGAILGESRAFEYKDLICDIDVQRLRYERRRVNTFSSSDEAQVKEFEMEAVRTVFEKRPDKYPFVPSSKENLDERCRFILDIQATGLATRMEAIGKNTALVIGLSGGLDSTLAIIVAAHACDRLSVSRKNIKALTMPCFGTTDRTYNNACLLAENIGAELIEVPIGRAVRQHFADIGHDESVHDVTYENCQARERTQVLMDYANKAGGIVVGTGDLSELALGWATYNADHMSMYNVNASIPKTLVRYIVKYEAETGEGELSKVLNDIYDTPVSPELLPPTGDGKISQKTEDLVGPYALHDFFLYYMMRFGFDPAKIYRLASSAFKGEFDGETIMKWEKTFYKRFFTQQFKRSCMPDAPKVGTVTLSPRGDWRMPSDAVSRLWLRALEELDISIYE